MVLMCNMQIANKKKKYDPYIMANLFAIELYFNFRTLYWICSKKRCCLS